MPRKWKTLTLAMVLLNSLLFTEALRKNLRLDGKMRGVVFFMVFRVEFDDGSIYDATALLRSLKEHLTMFEDQYEKLLLLPQDWNSSQSNAPQSSKHDKDKKQEGRGGQDPRHDVGDANRVIREWTKYVDARTGNIVYVGKKGHTVITDSIG